jgi:hypothetical protein
MKTRVVKTFSVNQEMFDKFKERCKTDNIKMSQALNAMLALYLASQPKNNTNTEVSTNG